MSEERTDKGRKSYLINPAFQLRFVGFTLFIAVLTLAIIYASNLYFVWKLVKIGKEAQFVEGHPFFLYLNEQQKLMDQVYLVTAFGIGLLIVIGGLWLSHRVAGPIHRIDTHIKACLEQRRFQSLQFRKGDFFPELADHVNVLLKELSQRKGSED